MKGWIALDIDGTITVDRYSVPDQVTHFLKNAQAQGWKIALATGRSFVFASLALKSFDFPFVLILQNGSIALDMPSQTVLFRKYLSHSLVGEVEKVHAELETDFFMYSGFENRDLCYFRPEKIPEEDASYMAILQEREKGKWVEVKEFPDLKEVPLLKAAGHFNRMHKLNCKLDALKTVQRTLIRDPFCPPFHILLITHANTSKGSALKTLFSMQGRGEKVIGAGDDVNDVSLLRSADIKIAMPHAPEELRKIADFIAPRTEDLGIIHALKIAMGES